MFPIVVKLYNVTIAIFNTIPFRKLNIGDLDSFRKAKQFLTLIPDGVFV
jgi:hypothetical protein